MFSGFDKTWLEALGKHIDHLERRSLEGLQPLEFDLAEILDGQSFLSIRGLADFWSTSHGVEFCQSMTDLVVGTHSQRQSYLTFVLAGTPQNLSVYISLGRPTMSKTMLAGILPGIHIDSTPVSDMKQVLNMHFQVKGVMSGIPTRKAGGGTTSDQQKSLPHTGNMPIGANNATKGQGS